MPDAIGRIEIFAPEAGHGVAIEAIGAKVFHEAGGCFGEWLAFIARSCIPRHNRKQNMHSTAMKIADHLPHARYASRQIAHHVVLVSVVDAYIRVDRPEEDGIDTAVTFGDIVKITIDRVLIGDRIVKIAVLNHRLRLHERTLPPG